MHTTVAIQPGTHEQLLAVKRAGHHRSIDTVIQSLLHPGPQTAHDLFALNREAISAVCRRYKITNLIAFGSRARGDARPDSDLDLCGTVPADFSLFDHGPLEQDLATAFGVAKVDFVSAGAPNARLQSRIDREGVLLLA